MSRIGTFADDDIYGWATKSPDLGGAIANFSQARLHQEPAADADPRDRPGRDCP